jgi:hypothetical protein
MNFEKWPLPAYFVIPVKAGIYYSQSLPGFPLIVSGAGLSSTE